jgi:hypothetical protein
VFVLAAVFASARGAFAFDRAAVSVPFSFKLDGETFPAGTYQVEFDSIHHTLRLSSKSDAKLSFVWIPTPAEDGPGISTLSLKFDSGADGIHVLRSIRLETWSTPLLDLSERRAAQHEASITGSP